MCAFSEIDFASKHGTGESAKCDSHANTLVGTGRAALAFGSYDFCSGAVDNSMLTGNAR